MGRATGKKIKIALEWAQLIAGTTTPVMEAREVLPHLMEPWIADTHRFLVQHNSEIRIPSLIIPTTRRRFDRRIMDVMMDQQFSDREVKDINNCRLFLQVETIADIATIQGDKIRDSVRKGECSGSISTLLWPVQEKPVTRGKRNAWIAWRKFLDSICTHDNTLRQPLGEWRDTTHRMWNEYYDPEGNHVYVKNQQQWDVYTVREKNNNKRKI